MCQEILRHQQGIILLIIGIVQEIQIDLVLEEAEVQAEDLVDHMVEEDKILKRVSYEALFFFKFT